MNKCNKFEQDFTKQKPILETDFLLDSGATLNLLNEDTWNEIKYNNPEIQLEIKQNINCSEQHYNRNVRNSQITSYTR